MVKFLRRTWNRYAKLGKGRKKKQVWRRPTGRDNKMREQKKGHTPLVKIGYQGPKSSRNDLNEKEVFRINNVTDLSRIGKDQIAVLANVGKKKRIEIAKAAEKMNVEFYNFNVKSFLKSLKNTTKKVEDKKDAKTESKDKPKPVEAKK